MKQFAEKENITEYLKDTTFKPFQKSTIRAIKVDELGTNSDSWFNEIVVYASSIGSLSINSFKNVRIVCIRASAYTKTSIPATNTISIENSPLSFRSGAARKIAAIPINPILTIITT